MKLARLDRWSRSVYVGSAVSVAVVYAFAVSGCIPGANSNPQVTIKAPTLDVDVRAQDKVVVSYEVTDPDGDPTTLSAYYDVDGQPDTNDEVLAGTGLPTGTSFYQLDTSAIPAGRYFILLEALDDRGGRSVRYAQGAMNVSSARVVTFQQPLTDISVGIGATVTIRFTCTESVNYVLFYDEDSQDNGNETEIASGSGQNVTHTWDLSNVSPSSDPGGYYIGVTVRDGLGVTDTFYAPGRVIVNQPPTVQVTGPATDLGVYEGERVPVDFSVSDPDSDARVSIFVDVDRVFGNGNETFLITGLPEDSGPTQYIDTTGLTAAAYYVGVSAADSVNDEVGAYAPGKIEVFSSALTVLFLEPTSDVTVAPTGSFTISWQVTAPSTGGTLSVLYVELDGVGDPTGEEMPVLSNASIGPGSTSFNASLLDVEEDKTYRLLIEANPQPSVDPNTTIASVRVWGPDVLVRDNPNVTLLQPTSSQVVGTGDDLFIEWEVTQLQGTLATITAQIYLDDDTIELSGGEIPLTPVAITPTGTEGTFRFSTTLDLSVTTVPPGVEHYLYLAVNDAGTTIGAYGTTETTVVQAVDTEELITVIVTPRITGTFWLGDAGKDIDEDGRPDSIVWIGFDFYDSAGSLVTPMGDFDGDGYSDFLVVAQFAKPFRATPVGDAYLIYGDPNRYAASLAVSNASGDPNISMLNLNTVGTTIRGTLFLGMNQADPPSDPNSSGIQSAMYIPDQTGDGVGELAFGVPFLHDRFEFYGRTAEGLTPTVLTRAGQFRRGGVILATSQNNFNQSSQTPLGIYFPLEMIGQFYGYSVEQVGWSLQGGTLEDPAAEERRVDNQTPGDANTPDVHYIELTSPDDRGWSHPPLIHPDYNDMAGPRPVPPLNRDPLGFVGDGENLYEWDTTYNPLLVDGSPGGDGTGDGDYVDGIPIDRCYYTGIYTGGQTSFYGSRLLGAGQGAWFGTVVDWWREGFVASSPLQDPDGFPGVGSRPNAGVVFFTRLTPLPWESAGAKPSNWVMAYNDPIFQHPFIGYTAAIIGPATGAKLGPMSSLGDAATGQRGDFNGDGLDDLGLGAPGMSGGNGAAYVFYVRLPEPYSFDLADLNVINTDPSRRAGLQVNGDAGEGLGSVVPAGLDFNGDGFADAAFGSPDWSGGAGRVVVVYGGPQVASTGAGFSVDDIVYGPGLNAATADPNLALGVVFEGENVGDSAGGAVVGIGDFDGDGLDDLLIAAPGADGEYDTDGDGTDEVITDSGVVYLIYGQRNVGGGTTKALTGKISLGEIAAGNLAGARFIGKSSGDSLGGGMTNDGTADRTRALGLSTAGDVDGDGLSDLLMSSVRAAPLGHLNAGEVYLIFSQAAE